MKTGHFTTLLALSLLAFGASASGGRIVRVGYFPEPGMMNGAEPGAAKSGYAYEYLQELASHAGWRYEYSYGRFDELYRKLKTGEIDVLPYVNYNDARKKEILFPEREMGRDRMYIAAKRRRLLGGDLRELAGKRIGTEKGTYNERRFRELLEDKGVTTCELAGFDSPALRWEALAKGTVDFTLEMSSMKQPDGMHAVYELPDEHPYYLAVAPSREDILAELNAATGEIATDNPGFLYQLKVKYFSSVPLFKMIPASAENWLSGHKVIRIGSYDHQAPFVYRDEKGGVVGIAPDCTRLVLSALGAETPIEWVLFDGRTAALSALRAGQVDLVHPYYHAYSDAERDGVIISSSVFDAPFGVLYRGAYTPRTLARVATPESRLGLQHVRDAYPNSTCVGCRDGYDCVAKLLAGEANSVVMYMPTLQMIASEYDEDFNIKSLSSRCGVCFAALPKNAALIGLVNKALPYMNAVVLNEIEDRHAVAAPTHVTFRDFLRQHAVWLYAASVVPLLVAFAVALFWMRSKREREMRELAEKSNNALKEHNLRMLALASDFEALYDVDVVTGEYELYVRGQTFADHVDAKLVAHGEFFEDAQKNIDLAVTPEFRDDIRRYMRRDFILATLEKEGSFESRYQLEVKGRPEWYRMRIVYKDETKRNFLLGVFSAKAEMEAKEKEREEIRRRELEEERTRFDVVQDVLQSAQWRFRVSADDRIVGYEYSSDVARLVKNRKASFSYDWQSLIHPDELAAVNAAFQAALRDHTCRTSYDMTFRMVDEKGEYNWFRSCGRMIRHADGSGDFLGIHIDVTERIRKEKAAAVKDQMISDVTLMLYGYNTTVDLSSGAHSVVGGTGAEDIMRLLAATKDYREAYGRAMERIRPEYHDRLRRLLSLDYLRLHQDHRGFFGREIYQLRGGDDARWGEANVIFSVDENGHVIANILGRDITEERRATERIQELERAAAQAQIDAAEETSRAKTAFLANMSHDIRTPMNAIIGFSDIARKHVDEPKKVAEYLDRVQLAGSSLLEIINDILDLSKIDSEKVEITEYPAWISRMPRYFGTILSTRMKEHGHTFVCEVGEVRDDTVWADKPHVNRILINLLSNAVKYTPDGGRILLRVEQLPDRGGFIETALPDRGGFIETALPPSGRARVDDAAGYATFRIVVQDNGMGMSAEYQRHLFERFTREKNSTLSGIQGTGIGMAIVKSLTDALGGTIEVDSKEGVGTTFTLTFDFRRRRPGEGEAEENGKLKIENEKCEERQTPQPLNSSTSQPLTRVHRILLVEDNEINREIATEILREAGFEVDVAVNGREAVEKVTGTNGKLKIENVELKIENVESNMGKCQSPDPSNPSNLSNPSNPSNPPYDLVLMDIMMPVMGGLEAARAIRKWENEKLKIENGKCAEGNSQFSILNSQFSHVPIIALSANAFSEDREASLAAGMDDHLAKPVKVKELMAAIEKVAGKPL